MITAVDDDSPEVVRLAVTEHGSGQDQPVGPGGQRSAGRAVVVLHGLFGSGRNWMTVARRLGQQRSVLAPDLRNHGASPWSDTMTYAAMAADIAALVEERQVPVALVGHSMGGKAAMLLALRRPDLVERLVVVDVAPVTYVTGFAEYAQAMQRADLTGVTRRGEVDVQLVSAVPDAGVRAFLLQNLVLDAAGARWRVNLPVLEHALPMISSFPSLLSGLRYTGPTMFVAGGRSDYVRREHADVVLERFPHAQLRVVPEAGHWVHAERVDDFLAVTRPFLDAAAGQRPVSR